MKSFTNYENPSSDSKICTEIACGPEHFILFWKYLTHFSLQGFTDFSLYITWMYRISMNSILHPFYRPYKNIHVVIKPHKNYLIEKKCISKIYSLIFFLKATAPEKNST